MRLIKIKCFYFSCEKIYIYIPADLHYYWIFSVLENYDRLSTDQNNNIVDKCSFYATLHIMYVIRMLFRVVVVSHPAEVNTRIVNGENSISNSWPMIVSLRNEERPSVHSCGGTILTESYILTAAHCVDEASNIENVTIATGVYNLSQPDQIMRRVDRVIIHPLWKEFRPALQYDIAILHLVEPLDLTKNSSLTRTCLPPRANTSEQIMQYPLNGTSLVVIGWGALETSGFSPDILQQATLHSMHHFDTACANTIRNPAIQFCAGFYQDQKG